jgi:hypothetical protein
MAGSAPLQWRSYDVEKHERSAAAAPPRIHVVEHLRRRRPLACRPRRPEEQDRNAAASVGSASCHGPSASSRSAGRSCTSHSSHRGSERNRSASCRDPSNRRAKSQVIHNALARTAKSKLQIHFAVRAASMDARAALDASTLAAGLMLGFLAYFGSPDNASG